MNAAFDCRVSFFLFYLLHWRFIMLTKKILSTGAAICALGLCAQFSCASNIINNPGFETAPTNPPTANDWQYNGGATWDTTNPYSGSAEANLNNTAQANNANVSQQTATGTITPGTEYTFSFYSEFTGVGAGFVGQAQLTFLNSAAAPVGANTFVNFPTTASGFGTRAGYQLSSVNVVAPAGASEAYVNLGAITGAVAGSSAHAYVDNVSLAPVSTPEPAALGLFAIGGLGLLLVSRKRMHRAS
jgi:hypothetical protein